MNEKSSEKPVGFGFSILFWILFLVLLTWLFRDMIDWQHNPNQEVQSTMRTDGVAEVVLRQNRLGHYVTAGEINSQPVRFLLDTGATGVSIPQHIAEKLGLEAGRPFRVQTANGEVTVYSTRLDSVSIGEIEINDLGGSINPHMDRDDILLGMRFLRKLEMIQRGDTLTLRTLM